MNTSIVVSPARPFQALNPDDLRRAAPSIYAEHAYAGVSSRYTFVSTAQGVALLAAEGWAPVKASEQRVRLETPDRIQLHEIRFAVAWIWIRRRGRSGQGFVVSRRRVCEPAPESGATRGAPAFPAAALLRFR